MLLTLIKCLPDRRRVLCSPVDEIITVTGIGILPHLSLCCVQEPNTFASNLIKQLFGEKIEMFLSGKAKVLVSVRNYSLEFSSQRNLCNGSFIMLLSP